MKKAIQAAIIALGLGFVGCDEAPRDVALEFVNALYAGNAAQAHALIAKPRQENINDMIQAQIRADITKMQVFAKSSGGLERLELVHEELDQNQAKITLEAHFGNDASLYHNLILQKHKGSYKIQSHEMPAF